MVSCLESYYWAAPVEARTCVVFEEYCRVVVCKRYDLHERGDASDAGAEDPIRPVSVHTIDMMDVLVIVTRCPT